MHLGLTPVPVAPHRRVTACALAGTVCQGSPKKRPTC